MRRVAALILIGCVAACTRLGVRAPEVHDYRLDYPPPALDGPTMPVILRLSPFAVAAVYDRDAIVYRQDDYRTGAYFYHRWTANPAAMLTDLLARDFAASGRYRAVQQGFGLPAADYDLQATIEEIEERIDGHGSHAHVRLRVTVRRTRASPEPIVWQSTYTADETSAGGDPYEFVSAMSRAVARMSAQVQHDVYAAIERDHSRPAVP
jgi:ABC-type uncharacterized transport system auxiliary subunit